MKRQTVVGKTMLAGKTACKVLYHQSSDMVELEVGGTTLKFDADHLIVINEMLRKAAARIVMQTEIEMIV